MDSLDYISVRGKKYIPVRSSKRYDCDSCDLNPGDKCITCDLMTCELVRDHYVVLKLVEKMSYPSTYEEACNITGDTPIFSEDYMRSLDDLPNVKIDPVIYAYGDEGSLKSLICKVPDRVIALEKLRVIRKAIRMIDNVNNGNIGEKRKAPDYEVLRELFRMDSLSQSNYLKKNFSDLIKQAIED